METLPDMLSEAVADATVVDTVDIGGGDVVAITNRTTYLYRSDGLLSDESVETFDHDIERLSVRTKRRKSEIQLAGFDRDSNFTVPSKSADRIIEAMLEGVLRTTGVVESDENVIAQFRFSELTLVVTDRRLFEHIGNAVWDEEFETIEYADLTGLDFEKGSVATQVVVETAARRRRVKVPNEQAGRVRRNIQKAVFDFHDVTSLEALRTELGGDPEAEPSGDDRAEGNSSGEDSSEIFAGGTDDDPDAEEFVSANWTPPADQEIGTADPERIESSGRESGTRAATNTGSMADAGTEHGTPDIETLAERIETLTERVDEQTERIESQEQLIQQLVEELRRGR